MRSEEYIRLAKLSMKENKKSIRSTIVGLAFGFIILIPIIVLLLGVNLSISDRLNQVPYVLYYETSMSDYRVPTEDVISQEGLINTLSGDKHIDKFLNNSDSNIIVYEKYLLTDGSMYDYTAKVDYSINNGEYNRMNITDNSQYNIIDIDKSARYFPQNLTDKYDGGIFVNGYGEGFVGDGKGQVVVSEKLLFKWGLNPQDIYNQSLSIRSTGGINLTGVNSDISGYVCKDYQVVGIVKSAIGDMYEGGLDYMRSDIFFTSANVYKDGAAVLKPRYEVSSNHSKRLVYDNWLDRESLNEEYMMLGWNATLKNDQFNYGVNNTFGTTFVYGESETYRTLNRSITTLEKEFYSELSMDYNILRTSNTYDQYETIYGITNVASLIFIIIGGVLALCAIINMYATIKHNVKRRKYYLTMLRAIGARDNVITRLYMTESVLMVTHANIWILTVGFILSVIIKYALGAILNSGSLNLNLSISWFSIIVAVLSVVILLYALGLLLSYICSRRVSKDKITAVINN